MKHKNILVAFLLLCSGFASQTKATPLAGDTVIFTPLGKYSFNLLYSGYTPLIDRLGRPYVYLATKELGVVTFDINNTSSPVPVDTQTVAVLGNLKATGLAQDNNYLFVSLGDFEGTTNAGLAIFDITNPLAPVLKDRWDSAAFNNGTSSVILQGNFAYLSAMTKGVIILDVADKQNIKFVSQIIPDTTFGTHSYVYHSRGLFLSGDTLLVADDNGGLRVINVTNKQVPVEIGKYLNTTLNTTGAAYYNHVYRLGNYAYCAVDFCGFEVVDVSTPSAMTSASWLNPWNCTNIPPPFGSWNGSDGHTNELAYSASHNVFMFAGGDSQVLAFDPSAPSQPRIMGAWGPPNDSVGTWGADVYGNLVALANIHTLGFPFISNIGGLQLLSWQKLNGIEEASSKGNPLQIYPNPANGEFTIHSTIQQFNHSTISIYNTLGEKVYSENIPHCESCIVHCVLPSGIYFVRLTANEKVTDTCKLIIMK